MPDKILLKRSLTSGSIPSTTALDVGELAINVPDGKLFLKQSGSMGETVRSVLTLGVQNSGSILFTGSVQITGSVSASNILATTLFGTASIANTASLVDYVNVVNKPSLVSASSQIDVRNTVGIATIATTGSNVFGGTQTINDTTNSTLYNNGALVVAGGVGIAKDVNISGSLTIVGLLTAVSSSVQYVTSSQLIIADNKIVVNTNDLLRFGGLSIIDSGSTSPTTASIYWDSLNNKFIYENLSGSAYNSAIFIAGPRNYGTLGNEVGLTVGRVPVAVADDHIDSREISSSIRVDFPSRLTHIEAGLYVTGAITTSVGFTGSLVGTLIGTSSWANNAISSSFATTASAATSITFTPLTSSFAITASYVDVTNIDNIQSVRTGSYTGSFTGSLLGTASWANDSISSSFATTASTATSITFTPGTASFATTASAATSITFTPSTASFAITASYITFENVDNLQSLRTGSFTGSFIGSLFGTSSWANNAISSSFATTASAATSITFIPNTASFSTTASAATSITFTPDSASFATTASYALNAGIGTGFPYSGSAVITGSLLVSGSGITGSLLGTASWANDSISSSFATTASTATSITFIPTTASFSITASYVIPSGLPEGVVSSSTQVDYTQIQNKPTTIATASYVDFANIVNKPTLVSSSTQINTGSFSGSFVGTFKGDGSQLTGVVASGVGIDIADDGVIQANAGRLDFGNFISTTVIASTASINVTLPAGTVSSSLQISTGSFTGSFIGIHSGSIFGTASWASNSISSSFTTTASYATTSSIATTANSVDYTNITNKPSLVSASSQIDVRNTTGIVTISTTGSNTFNGIQTISDTTNSTVFNNGALVVAGGVGIAKDVNISGSVKILGLLTVASMSTQYVTSSQYVVGDNRILLNADDIARFGGVSVFDSGSTAATGSLYWDSLNNWWLYENASGSAYNSAILIAGPKNTGALGNETGLIAGRIPVATGDDHIDTALASSSLRIEFTDGKTHVEKGLYVTGSITASVGFNGNGTGITGVISSSFATTASAATSLTFVPTTASFAPTSSFAITASAATSITFTPSTASYALTASVVLGIVQSSSFATTASAATSITFIPSTASFATTSSYISVGNVDNIASVRTGSFTGSFIGIHSGSTFGTASWANNSISSSFSTTASAATSITFTPTTASFANTAPYSGLIGVPTGIVSSSTQVISLLPAGTVSSSGQVSYTGLSNIPTGILSSSTQINALTGVSASFATTASAATSITFIPATASYALTSAGTMVNASTASYLTSTLGNGSPIVVNTNNGSGATIQGAGNGQTAQLRIVANGGGWVDSINTAYFQISSSTGNYVSFMGGTYGADAPLERLQFNAKGTQISNVAYGQSPVPSYALQVINLSSSATPVFGILATASQTANYFDITTSGSTAGNIFSIRSNGTVSASGNIEATINLVSNNSVGDEGGEINLARPQTNTAISGSVVIDVFQNKIRLYEKNSPNRGGYWDITSLTAGVGTNLAGGAGTVTSITAGNGLTGGTITSAGTITLDTGSTHFITGSVNVMNLRGVFSSSNQVSYTGLSNVPSGILSSSTQINALSGVSASFATTASAATSITFTPTSASYALSASYTPGTTFPYIGAANITGSLTVSGSGITGSLFGTSSWANNSISSSFATTASAATSITFIPSTASFATTASYVANASSFPYVGTAIISGSLIVTGSTAVSITGSTTVLGTFQATTKSFKIDHQRLLGKSLIYGVLEGPEHAVYVRGRLTDGHVIPLPDEWEWLVDEQSITVQLTPIGQFQQLYIDTIEDNCVIIRNVLGTTTIDCYYVIYATRKDVKPLQTVE